MTQKQYTTKENPTSNVRKTILNRNIATSMPYRLDMLLQYL